MIRRASFHRLAQLEVLDGSAYDASVGEGLGSEFLDELDRVRHLLVAHPEIGPVVRDNIRKKILREFPYTVFYSIRLDEIRILAVGHQKRRPFYWRGRR